MEVVKTETHYNINGFRFIFHNKTDEISIRPGNNGHSRLEFDHSDIKTVVKFYEALSEAIKIHTTRF